MENLPSTSSPNVAQVASSQPETFRQRPVTRTPSATGRPWALGTPDPQKRASGSAKSSCAGAPGKILAARSFAVTQVPATHAVEGQERPRTVSLRATASQPTQAPPCSWGVRRAKTPSLRSASRLSAAGRSSCSLCSAWARRTAPVSSPVE